MRRPPETLEEARQERLRSGRRGEAWERWGSAIGVGVAIVLLVVVAIPVCGWVVPLGRRDMAAGEPSDAILIPWDDAQVVFREIRPGGPNVQARHIALGRGVPPGAEFRVDGTRAGVVFGERLRKLDLRGARVTLDAEGQITIHLPPGYHPARGEVEAGRWKVRYRIANEVPTRG